MKKGVVFMGCVAFILWMVSCAPQAYVTSSGGPTIDEAQAERYDGPKARLAVGRFQDKTARGGVNVNWFGMYGLQWKQIGDGMRDMLTTALFNSNRYIVLEREQLDEVLKEQDLAAAGRVKKDTEAPTGEIYGAELLITAAITEFQAGEKGIGGATKVLGIKVGGGIKRAHIAMDIRVIDTKTSQIVFAGTVEGKATDVGLGGYTNIGGSLPVEMGGFSRTPIEKAIRICIYEAVKLLASKTPPVYYRHK